MMLREIIQEQIDELQDIVEEHLAFMRQVHDMTVTQKKSNLESFLEKVIVMYDYRIESLEGVLQALDEE